ncbi:SigE family RNA polymerase sigma factor [Catellatospora paridis]|uniref:SigE family RNA polymerase sigma factor n=1 Tax=Catellatospora paridis TaxID=1617086 RepID=UPI0012D3E317|nr:SigE family RNA polymerase sigma factor [Catellatospora paridis]
MTKSEEEQFRVFVAERMDRWRRTAYLLSRDWHTADDLVSVTVGRLYRHWRKVRAADNPEAYAQRVLTRVWLDETVRPWRRERVTAELPERAVHESHGFLDRDGLNTLLGELGPRQRAVVVLRYYLDYSVEETAEVLGISVGTVKSQSARGLETLRRRAVPMGGMS